MSHPPVSVSVLVCEGRPVGSGSSAGIPGAALGPGGVTDAANQRHGRARAARPRPGALTGCCRGRGEGDATGPADIGDFWARSAGPEELLTTRL